MRGGSRYRRYHVVCWSLITCGLTCINGAYGQGGDNASKAKVFQAAIKEIEAKSSKSGYLLGYALGYALARSVRSPMDEVPIRKALKEAKDWYDSAVKDADELVVPKIFAFEALSPPCP